MVERMTEELDRYARYEEDHVFALLRREHFDPPLLAQLLAQHDDIREASDALPELTMA
jgi:hypothetical protein